MNRIAAGIILLIFIIVLAVICAITSGFGVFAGGGYVRLRGIKYVSMFTTLGELNPTNCMFVGENHCEPDPGPPGFLTISDYVNQLASYPNVSEITVLVERPHGLVANPTPANIGSVNALFDIMRDAPRLDPKVTVVGVENREAINAALGIFDDMHSMSRVYTYWLNDSSQDIPTEDNVISAFNQVSRFLSIHGRNVTLYNYCTVDDLIHDPVTGGAHPSPKIKHVLESYRIDYINKLAQHGNYHMSKFLDAGFMSHRSMLSVGRHNCNLCLLANVIDVLLLFQCMWVDMVILFHLLTQPPDPKALIVCITGVAHSTALTDFIRAIPPVFPGAICFDTSTKGPAIVPEPLDYVQSVLKL